MYKINYKEIFDSAPRKRSKKSRKKSEQLKGQLEFNFEKLDKKEYKNNGKTIDKCNKRS